MKLRHSLTYRIYKDRQVRLVGCYRVDCLITCLYRERIEYKRYSGSQRVIRCYSRVCVESAVYQIIAYSIFYSACYYLSVLRLNSIKLNHEVIEVGWIECYTVTFTATIQYGSEYGIRWSASQFQTLHKQIGSLILAYNVKCRGGVFVKSACCSFCCGTNRLLLILIKE